MPFNISPTQVAFNARGDGKFNKPFQEQVDFLRDKINLPTEHYDDILKSAHDRAFVVAGATKADLLADFHDAINKAVLEGKSIQWFKKEFESIVQKHGWEGWTGSDTKAGRDWRARIIYKTNLSASYAAGRYEQLTHPDLLKSRPYWKYIHNDTVAHPRPLHVAWSGLVLRWDDPFWQTHFPPNGWGCRCRITAVSAKDYDGAQAPDEGVSIYKDRAGNNHVIPKGIDYGWDYAPGASISQQTSQFVADKIKALPPLLGLAFKADIDKVINANSVSKSLTLPAGKTGSVFKTVLTEIDNLHGIDGLPTIPAKSSRSVRYQGVYRFYPSTNKAVDIQLSSSSVNPELTVAHEIGHFIDHQSFNTAGVFSSINDDLMAAFRRVVDESTATATLKEHLATATDRNARERAKYYLSAYEQWARAYAQWVALRSNNQVMIDQVNKIIGNTRSPAYSASQWQAADFEPIAKAIDEIFNSFGWLK